VPQVSASEFEQVPLRVHTFLEGVPLHDVWVIDLPRPRTGVTLEEFLRASNNRLFRPSLTVRVLLGIRFLVGRLFGWDRDSAASKRESFDARLTPADRTGSLVPPGTQDGFFRVVYRFENEQLLEVINQTVHAAALSALAETATGYRFYFAVYVHSVGRLTPIYMAVIDPFRKWIVYPSLLRSLRTRWNQTLTCAGP